MKIIEFEGGQGSEEWLSWRRSRITATDCSCILGINPWKTAFDLWQEKLEITLPEPFNERMARGQKLEPEARDLFIKETGIQVEPMVIEHHELWWHASSLDGINSFKTKIVEIKCPSKDTHNLALEGGIKPYYEAQMMHQLFTSGAEICYYVSYNPDAKQKLVILEVMPNQKYIKDMLEKERYFYEVNLCTMKPPEGDWKLCHKENL